MNTPPSSPYSPIATETTEAYTEAKGAFIRQDDNHPNRPAPDEELAGQTPQADHEHLRFVAAA